MGNTIEKAKIYLGEMLDEKMVQELTTGWMEANAGMTRYTGGNEIKVPKISFDGGLGNYNRASGFASGDVTLTYETHTFDMDRSRTFSLDAMDVDESGFAAIASNVTSEFQSQHIVPEVDAYRFSKLFTIANTAMKTGAYTPATDTIFQQLKNDVTAIKDVVGDNVQLVCMMSFSAANILDQADKIEKSLSVTDFTSGAVNSKVQSLDGMPIIRVSSSRFKSAFTFGSDGFSAAATAMNLNWIIIARNVPVGIVKTDKLRVFQPDVNQDADAWKIDLRKYHTLIVPDNKVNSMYVSYAETAAPALTATVAKGTASGTTKFTAEAGTENTLGYTLTTTEESGYFNTIPTITAYTSGDDIAATVGQFLNMYEVDAAGRVQKFTTAALTGNDIKAAT